MRLGTYDLHIFHCLFRKKKKEACLFCQGFVHLCVKTGRGTHTYLLLNNTEYIGKITAVIGSWYLFLRKKQ